MTPQLVMTRPRGRAGSFLIRLQHDWGGPLDVVDAPALELVSLTPETVPPAAALILTSVHAVAEARRLGYATLPAYCVGDRTAAAAGEAGFAATSAGGDSDDLVALILQARPTGPLVHVAGQYLRGEIAARLRAAGLECHVLTAYRQDALPPPTRLQQVARGNNPVVAPVFSPRSTHILTKVVWTAPLTLIAMSPAVAEAAAGLPTRSVTVAEAPTEPAMRDATLAALRTSGSA